MNRKKLSVIITIILFFLLASALLIINSKKTSPLYTEASSNYALTSYNKNSANNDLTNSRKNIITETVKKISPAVVGINVTEIQQVQPPFGSFFDDPFFRQFFGNRGNYNQKVKELGSGYIISPDGYIVTNDHVAGNASEVTVTLTNGKHYKAKVIGSDRASDVCLLKINGKDFPFAPLGNSDNVMIGEWVIAFGNPFGLFEISDKPTVTVGVLSATAMNLEPLNDRFYLNMLQTDAAINGGNSGGPLVNSIGEVIGMNTLIYTAGGVQGNIGLGFAIPINKVKKIITELKEKGKIDRDFDIGLKIQNLDDQLAQAYNLDDSRGVVVTQVIPRSPAYKAGIKSGDIIKKIDNYSINNILTMQGVFQEFRTGQTITVYIIRDGKDISKQMKLEKSR